MSEQAEVASGCGPVDVTEADRLFARTIAELAVAIIGQNMERCVIRQLHAMPNPDDGYQIELDATSGEGENRSSAGRCILHIWPGDLA